jgi:FlaG/FlaF family flagellin (archaellin)
MIKKIRSKQAVSEVVGIVLLLGITITLFAILNANVSQFFFGSSSSQVNLIGTLENNTIFIEHNGGESLEGKTKIIITINNISSTYNTSDKLIDLNKNTKWDIGEIFEITYTDLENKYIGVTVIASNTILLSAVLQQVAS